MKRLKHLFKYVFNSAYRFECNGRIKFEPEKLKTIPLMGQTSFSQKDVEHLKTLRDAVEAKKTAQLLVDAGMATWRSEWPDIHIVPAAIDDDPVPSSWTRDNKEPSFTPFSESKMAKELDNHGDAEKFKKAFNDSVNDPSHLIGNEAQNSFELFAQTLDIIIAEVKRQFLNGAQRIVLTRDGDSVFCEPDDTKGELSL